MANVVGDSSNASVPGVKGDYTGAGTTYVHNGGTGVLGHSGNGYGVHGVSENGRGVVASSTTNYALRAHSVKSSGARCTSDEGVGIEGGGTNAEGVRGTSTHGIGVVGESVENEGVRGVSHSGRGGVVGINDWSPAAPPGAGGNGGWFESTQGEGVRGWAKNPNHGGVVGVNSAGGIAVYGNSPNAGGVGVWGEGHRLAGFFRGDVEVTGDIRLTHAADLAEHFDASEAAEPGTVMVLGDEGSLSPSQHAYDKRVAGVISGAGHYKPGIILDEPQSLTPRVAVGLMGKVFCKVDARSAPIEIGDLLTTSATPGHAMKATDVTKAFGSVIGKALRPLKDGQGLIPILVALQ